MAARGKIEAKSEWKMPSERACETGAGGGGRLLAVGKKKTATMRPTSGGWHGQDADEICCPQHIFFGEQRTERAGGEKLDLVSFQRKERTKEGIKKAGRAAAAAWRGRERERERTREGENERGREREGEGGRGRRSRSSKRAKENR